MKKSSPLTYFVSLAAFAAVAIASFTAVAESSAKDAAATSAPIEGIAVPYQLGFQLPVTPVMEKLDNLHNMLLVIITTISVLVLLAMIYICVRYSRKRNPVASKTTHNTTLEIIWTTVPILILVIIAIPSLRLHYYMQKPVETTLTVKAVGYQWYWHYDYPDNGGFGFDSYMLTGADLKPSDHRQLSVDNRMVVPVNTKVRVLITAGDVIHSWSVPSFGVKKDAIPGRLNETWFEATRIGTFYGQCSQLCGVKHGFMPVVVEVVSKEDFDAWIAKKKQDAGIVGAETPASKTLAPAAKDKSEGAKKKSDASDKMDVLAKKNAKLKTSAGMTDKDNQAEGEEANEAAADSEDKE